VARCGQFQGFRAAYEKLDPRLVFKPLHLVAERGLGDVQYISRARQTTGLVNGADRTKVAELDVHYEVGLIM
jgi:hypothetical protein